MRIAGLKVLFGTAVSVLVFMGAALGQDSFTVALDNTTPTVAQGSQTSVNITITPTGNFAGTVTLTAASSVTGPTITFGPGQQNSTQVVVTAHQVPPPTTMTVATASNTTIQSYVITVTATSGAISIPTQATLTVSSAPSITTVNVLSQGNATGSTKQVMIEIAGVGLQPGGIPPTVLIVPGIDGVASLIGPGTDSLIRAEFTVPQDYQLQQVVLSYPNRSVSKDATGPPCKDSDIVKHFNFMPNDQVKNKYGNGVAAHFHVIQISIVNKCTHNIVVPLAGIAVAPTLGGRPLMPLPLSHVTAEYNADRKLTGTRAIFFNSLAAAATLGSAVEPFLGHGFTQGVAIWGGGFTTAANTIFKDMSPEQLQNLATDVFGDSEQVAANGGSLNKFAFFSKLPDKKKWLLFIPVGTEPNSGGDPFGADPVPNDKIYVRIQWLPTSQAVTSTVAPTP